MLSEKIKNYLIESRLYDDTADEAYQKVISNLGIDLETPFAQFNLYTNAVTFTGNRAELYNVCWFAINSIYYEQMASMRSVFRLPESTFRSIALKERVDFSTIGIRVRC